MIKKFNNLIDDMPLIIKLIVGVIMTAFLTLMGVICWFALGIINVNAAAVNPTSNEIHTVDLNEQNEQYINIGQNQEYTLSITRKADFFVSNFLNLGTGVYKGTAYIKYYNIQNETCATIKSATSRVTLSLNDVAVVGTVEIPSCNISDNYVTIKINYTYTNMQTNGTFKLIYRMPGWNSGFKYLMNSTLDHEAKDYATNTDIQNQTITIINNAIQNAQDIINNSIQENILNRNAISSAVDSAASQIINNAVDLSKNCKDETIEMALGEETKSLQTDGITGNSTNYNVTKYYEIDIGDYTFTRNNTSNIRYCLYDINKENAQCYEMGTGTTIQFTNNRKGYVRATYRKNSYIKLNGKICQSNTDALLEGMTNIEKVLYEVSQMEDEDSEEQKGLLRNIISGISNLFNFFDDDDTDDPDNALGDLNENFATNNVISSLLLLPVSLYQNILNNINNNCNSFNLGTLYGHNLTMTCIVPQNFLGSALYSVIDVIISGFFIYHIRKKFVDIFLHLTSLKTGGNELE